MRHTRRDILRWGAIAGGIGMGVGTLSGPAAAHLVCPRSPGYWRNHIEEWPNAPDGNGDEDSPDDTKRGRGRRQAKRGRGRPGRDCAADGADYLSFGAVTLSKGETLALLESPPRGDKAVILARQYIARRLNFHNMSPDNECVRQFRAEQQELDGISGTRSEAQRWFDGSSWPEGPQRSWIVDGIDGEAIKDFYESFNTGDLCDGC